MQGNYGKYIGFMLGWFLLRHPIGMLIGVLIGHVFDVKQLNRDKNNNNKNTDFDNKLENPYQELGVAENATNEEIHLAYRRLISQYHPDKLSGIPADLQKIAEQRASKINIAYQKIKNLRKIF